MADDLQQMASQTIWRRQVAAFLARVLGLTGSKTYDIPSLNTGTQDQTTVTVTGAALGNFAQASFSLDLQGITLSAAVSAANTVTATFRNDTGGTLDIGSGTLTARVFA